MTDTTEEKVTKIKDIPTKTDKLKHKQRKRNEKMN